jgi:hypothetical protein
MKKSLISPMDSPVTYISGWTDETPAQPITSIIQGSYRIAEVCDQTFPVSEPLFWVDCEDDVVADEWYLDIETGNILLKPNVPSPNPPLPS